ncbi:hypothetical protein BB934_15860 [Microvirga ossetica]|uniref:Uncharacterized protein n=1 Tax=Microvirga ossetica TaxID=1882682 RepID=A0A1B2EHS2_9HYPH|nr:hypothetical protein BB934_15860 [Microvirga ossetica]
MMNPAHTRKFWQSLEEAGAQHLVREALHVLEDHQSGNQPHRQGRLARSRPVDAAQAALEEGPVDALGQQHQGMAQVDDAVQGGAEQILLALVFRRRHGATLAGWSAPD